MREDKTQALKLRLSGSSYSEIQNELGVPKSTLSGWFSGLQISSKAQARINKKIREGSLEGLLLRSRKQAHFANLRARKLRTQARTEIGPLSQREIFLLGVSLYWAEGYKRVIIRKGMKKTFHPISMVNSDPEMIKMFLRFIREVCEVPEHKIFPSLRIYDHQNEKELLAFWSGVTGLPLAAFRKSYKGVSRSSQGTRPFNVLPYGTIQIRVNDTQLYHRVMGWIEGLYQS